MSLLSIRRFGFLILLLAGFSSMQAATFTGSSRANSQNGGDSSNAFSGNAGKDLTVSCWFKMSIPTGITLSKDMMIMSNRQSSTLGGNFAFEIAFSVTDTATAGNVVFRARGATTALAPQVLIAQPFLDRWYHVAVTRNADTFNFYLDGRPVGTKNYFQAIGTTTNSNGITIGGTSDNAPLYGEVIEVAIYRRQLTDTDIPACFLPTTPRTIPTFAVTTNSAQRLLQIG